ncbi:hypothetical protein PHET_05960 [Paragonimus heterotremus]|uniref:Uncharacterized protein n=1 Tax=Paragonimus heterotremus TaxID=100268 RepID=A0A8J4SZF3_9TREM|nr:hypothetical protein PHET_05960 [Paragonimus heterotremus]
MVQGLHSLAPTLHSLAVGWALFHGSNFVWPSRLNIYICVLNKPDGLIHPCMCVDRVETFFIPSFHLAVVTFFRSSMVHVVTLVRILFLRILIGAFTDYGRS